MNIPRDAIQEVAPHCFVTDASDCQIQGWPAQLVIVGVGNGQPFVAKSKKLDRDGDVQYVRYDQLLGRCSLLVYND